MPVEGWRERHDTCRFGTYRPDDTEGLVVAGCEHPEVGTRYDEKFCAQECPLYRARSARVAHGRIPLVFDHQVRMMRHR